VRLLALLPVLLLLATTAGCSRGDGIIDLRSPAFDDGAPIPERHSCEGENQSPPLEWSEVDEDAVELALVMADLETETGIFHHWVVLGIDPELRSLPAGRIPAGAVLARTTADNAVYIGPCPPEGEVHEYLFTLFQLDRRLELPEGTPTKEALDAIDEARLPGEGELRGTFGR
jgi:Raf kinase inhibitor-like YbhB/YbcL family protein